VIDLTPGPVALTLGPLAVPWYGIGYATALAVGVPLARTLARVRGLDPIQVGQGLLWVLVFGIAGARLYHVVDQWSLYREDLLRIILPPYSGLALYGGVVGGLLGLVVFARRRGLPALRWADVAVPSLFLGQAIARWGNFANQELYGPPTSLPWGIAIDCAHRVAAYPCSTYPFATTGFQPLFFYESALDLMGALLAITVLVRLRRLTRPGDVVGLWLIYYGVVRALLETMRGDYDWQVAGAPVATMLGIVAAILGSVLIGWNHRSRRRPDASPPP